MPLKKTLASLFAFAATSLAFLSDAAAANAPCSNCTLAQQEGVALTQNVGKHLVYDVPGKNFSYWWVTQDRETLDFYANQLSIPQTLVNAYRFAVSAGSVEHFTFTPGGPVDPTHPYLGNPIAGVDPTLNAYLVADDFSGYNRMLIETRLSQWLSPGVSDGMLDALSRDLLRLVSGGREVYITVRYADGSRETYKIGRGEIFAKYVPGSARDANGNPIPDSSVVDDAGSLLFEGTFEFKDQISLDTWVSLMAAQGVPVTGPQSGKVTCIRVQFPPPGQWECFYK